MDKLLSSGKSLSGRERNCAYLNLGPGKAFATVSASSGFDFPDDARGVAPVDWDFDGDLDLWLGNRSGPQARFLRNDNVGDHNWVQFKLEGNGTTTNRDAIGARIGVVLERNREPIKLIKTLRAGEGFLSQHSKWVHFGLGAAAAIDRVTVRWPGGDSEIFAGVQPNTHYRLAQGAGTAQPWKPPQDRVRLAASTPDMPDKSATVAVFLTNRLPLPDVTWQTFDGETVGLNTPPTGLQADQPVLINLWASWCSPCVAELNDFSEHHQRLQDVGLRVVALSVDGLGDYRGTPQKAVAMANRLRLPFDTGMADPRMIQRLDTLFDRLFQIYKSLPVPTSVLLAGDGRVAAIYKGRVSIERLLDDIQHLDTDPPQRRERMTPFAGRWLTPPKLLPLSMLIVQSVGRDDLGSALAYADLAIAEKTEMASQGKADWDVKLPDTLANLAAALLPSGQLKEAERMCRQAIALEPGNIDANFALGEVLLLQKRMTHASRQFQVMLQRQPTHVGGNYRMGWLLLRRGRVDHAVNYFRNALRADPGHQLSLLALAKILSTHWDPRYRDGREALKLAQSACVATEFSDAVALNTLAGAHAEVGAFAEAVRIAQDALIIAEQSEQNQLAEFIRGNLALFQAGRPYHQRKPERR